MSEALRALVCWVDCREGLGRTEAWAEGQAQFSPLDSCEIICHLILLPSLYQILSPCEKCPKLGTNTSSSVLLAAHFIFRPSASALWTSCGIFLLVFCLLIELSEAP